MNLFAPALTLAVLPYFTIPDGHLGPLPIHPFGLLVATGIIVGHRIATKRAAVLGLDAQQFESLVFWTVAVGIVLSHVLDTIFYHPEVLADRPWELLMIHHGLSSFGGFFGAMVGFFGYTRRYKIDRWLAADAICYGLPVGWLFGRTGCTVVHDHPGRHSTHWLAVNYPGGARFDLGLMELMLTPLLIALVFFVGARTKRRGVVTSALAIAYPILRFPLDFLRATDAEGGDVRYFGLTPGHFASLGMLSIGLFLAWRASKAPATPEPEPALAGGGATAATVSDAGEGGATTSDAGEGGKLPPRNLRLKKKPDAAG